MKSYLLIFTALLLTVSGLAFAQDDDDWEAKRDELLKRAEKEIEEIIDQRASPQAVASSMGIPYPVEEPKKNKLQVRGEVLNLSKELADKEYDQKRLQELIEKIIEKNSLFKIGEIISFDSNLKGGETISGRLHAVNKDHIHVGNRWISTRDLPNDVRDRFYENTCEALQARKAENEKRKFKVLHDKYAEEKFNEMLPKMLFENGYYPLNGTETSHNYLDLANWNSMMDVFEDTLSKRREQIDDSVRHDKINAIMKSNGFVYDSIKKEWVPEEMEDQPKVNVNKNTKPQKGFFQKIKDIFGN